MATWLRRLRTTVRCTAFLPGVPLLAGAAGCQDARNGFAEQPRQVIAVAAPPDTVPSDEPAELPREYVDTRMPSVTGRTIRVAAGGDLQAALNAAVPGDEIVLQPGATYTGNFLLPPKSGSGWIVVRTSGSLPAEGTRVTPANASAMPRLVGPGGTNRNEPVIRTQTGTRYWRLVGLEITAKDSESDASALVSVGGGSVVADQASNIVFDRSYIHGTENLNFRRCLLLNGASLAVIDSWVADCHGRGFDSQAIVAWSGSGPYKIVNNYLEGAGENVMFGGADSRSSEFMPRDIEIRRNHFFKPKSWEDKWTVKNLFELKVGQRVLIEGNVFENNWRDGQTGYAIVLKSTNQSGRAPWSQTSDVTFRYNIVRNSANGVNIAANPEKHPAVKAARFHFAHNVFDIGTGDYSGGRIFQISGVAGVTLDRNSGVGDHSILNMIGHGMHDLVVTNNLFGDTRYGVRGDGAGIGRGSLDEYAPGWTFIGNVIAGASAGRYPPDNSYPARLRNTEFVDLVVPRSVDALRVSASPNDAGANLSAVRYATAGVVVQPP